MGSRASIQAKMAIQPHGDADYDKVLKMCVVEKGDGFDSKYDKKGIKVWTKAVEGVKAKILRIQCTYDQPMDLLFDVLCDDEYRATWDKMMIEGRSAYMITPKCTIDYFATKSPGPLKSRDMVVLKSWRSSADQCMIVQNSIDVEELPPLKKFVRCISYLSAHVLDRQADGKTLYTHISHFDPRGDVPKVLASSAVTSTAPKSAENLSKAAGGYAAWKAKHDPAKKPWLDEAQMALPQFTGKGGSADDLRRKLSAMGMDESEAEGGEEAGAAAEAPAEE